jgi:hypothetical protein
LIAPRRETLSVARGASPARSIIASGKRARRRHSASRPVCCHCAAAAGCARACRFTCAAAAPTRFDQIKAESRVARRVESPTRTGGRETRFRRDSQQIAARPSAIGIKRRRGLLPASVADRRRGRLRAGLQRGSQSWSASWRVLSRVRKSVSACATKIASDPERE